MTSEMYQGTESDKAGLRSARTFQTMELRSIHDVTTFAKEEAVLLITTLLTLFQIYAHSYDEERNYSLLLIAIMTVLCCAMEKMNLPIQQRRNASPGLFYGLALAPAIMAEIGYRSDFSECIHLSQIICSEHIKVSIWLILYFCCSWHLRIDSCVALQPFLYVTMSGFTVHFLFGLKITLQVFICMITILLGMKFSSCVLPNCFTFGELSLLLNLVVPFMIRYTLLSSLVQVALVTNWVLFFVILFLSSLILPCILGRISAWVFYSCGILLLACLLCVLFTLLPRGFFYWAAEFLCDNWPNRQYLLILWLSEIFACAIYVTCFRPLSKKSSTSERKLFHLLIIMTFVPGLLYDVPMLFFCSVGATCALAVLEAMRALTIPPLSGILNERFSVFVDAQDQGCLILTPFYLLLGQSLPIWAACFQEPSLLTMGTTTVPISAFSGILSVGVGDTAASVIGSKFGRHRWANSRKTIEGTLSSVITQSFLVWLLCGAYGNGSLAVGILATLSVSLVEAFTSQIDNLILPMYMYFILNG